MKRIKNFFELWGIHCFLLPLFFVLHNYAQYFGLVSSDVAVKTLLKILLIFLLFFLLLLYITRNINKSMQLTTLFGVVILFYGNIKDFLQLTFQAHFISRYSVLLPLILVVTIILSRIIFKKKNYQKSNLFQNLLLITFIFIDGVILLFSDRNVFLQQNFLTKNTQFHLDSLSNNILKPDVYYLVFDSYPGTAFLKEYMKYDNSSFDSTLQERGFHVIKNPKSNYNKTAFSISSTLNFEYLDNIKNFSAIGSKDYNQALLTINHSLVPKIFKKLDYKFYNLSIFSIDDVPPIRKESFLTISDQKVLLYNTLTERLKRDILWNLLTGKYAVGLVQEMFRKNENEFRNELIEKKVFNGTVIDSVLKIPSQTTSNPKFIYAHFYLPHSPYFYDENGKSNNINYIVTVNAYKNKQLFLTYLRYTNRVMLKIINEIIRSQNKNVLILLQGDHGFTDFEGGPTEEHLSFKNYSAVYFPDKNYSMLYDTVSNINTFPILFNKYFNTKIPLQRDTSFFLKY